MSQPIVVIGSTGKTGHRIVKRLSTAGHDVRGVSRRSDPPFVWEDRSTWLPALRGARAAYVSFVPDLAAPGSDEIIAALAATAAEVGVRRLVLLSGRGESGARRSEDVLLASGLEATVVRAAWFAQNFSEGHLLPAVLDGVIALPAGDVAEPFVDVDDIADVAVAALTSEGHAGRVYEVTGPRPLSFADAAAEIAEAAGHDVVYAPITLEEFHAALLEEAGPEFAGVLTEVARETLDGRNSFVADGVRQALGREPRDFTDFCADAAAAGAWKR